MPITFASARNEVAAALSNGGTGVEDGGTASNILHARVLVSVRAALPSTTVKPQRLESIEV